MKIEKIRKHCEWIIDHFKEINYFDEFTNNEELVYSSAFVLSQIGELAKRLDQEKKKIYPNVPWHNIVGLRNRIIHDYSGIDLEIIYDICTNDIPELLENLK